MAKIIKPPSGHKKVKCKECLATIAYAPIEIKTQSLYSMGEFDGSYKYIECSNCKEHIVLKESK